MTETPEPRTDPYEAGRALAQSLNEIGKHLQGFMVGMQDAAIPDPEPTWRERLTAPRFHLSILYLALIAVGLIAAIMDEVVIG